MTDAPLTYCPAFWSLYDEQQPCIEAGELTDRQARERRLDLHAMCGFKCRRVFDKQTGWANGS
jgi:hypothetical protein